MKKLLLAIVLSLFVMSVALAQEAREPRMEITGVNASDLPTVSVLVNVFNRSGQPIPDLTIDNFNVVGELADRTRIVDVKSFSDQNVPIAVVLLVDVSSSMAGTPIESAKEAASSFIEAIGPEDPVAIVTFASSARLVQDFTTDRPTLLQAIDGLGFGGQTYLFDGVAAAVDKASEIENPRRAIIVLSDGAQYDTSALSRFTSENVLEQATVNGIPIYTIGLGFGVDRLYLQGLSTNTNGLFRESPTPAELEMIFAELADLLRTQYEVTLEVDVPLDGTTYDLEMEADTRDGIVSASGLLRAPVPVPVITVSAPESAIDISTDIEALIVADDGLSSVMASLDGGPEDAMTGEPYVYTVDPLVLSPGAHRLTFTATDEDGDVGTASVDFDVAALPSQVIVVPALGGEIADVQIFTLDVSGQTPAVSAQFQLDDTAATELTEPFSFTIDPFNLAPGEHTATVIVENAGGVTTTTESTFSIPELPIQFAIEGITAGELLEDSVTINVDVESSQAPGEAVAFELNGAAVPGENGSLTLNAVDLTPGPATLSVIVTNEAGQTTSQGLNFEVAALPPQVTIIGLEAGETLEEDRQVSVETVSQTAMSSVSFQLDGQPLEADASTTTLNVLEIEPGTHILSITVDNEGGQSTHVGVDFAVSEGPSLTATARSVPSATPILTATSTSTQVPTATVEATMDETATSQATRLTATAESEATSEALVAVQTTATADTEAMATQDELDVRATATTEAEAQATAAEAATAEEIADATATGMAVAQAATATLNAQATLDLLATANARATANAEATSDAEASATAATSEAEKTVQAQAAAGEQATADAQSAATTEAEMTAQAADQQATADAEATQNMEMTATMEAEALAQAAAVVESTQSAESTATSEAEITVQAAMLEQATADIATQVAAEQATADAATEVAADQQSTADAEATSRAADEQATADIATQVAADEQATADADATTTAGAEVEPSATLEATQDVTDESNVTPTEAGTPVAQAVTDTSATPTVADEASPAPSVTPIGTLIPAQAETTPSSQAITPIVIIIVIVVILLLLIYFFLSRARRQ